VGEPTVEDTIAIRGASKEKYEVHHGAHQGFGHRGGGSSHAILRPFSPDKAIDLVDEAALSLRIQIDSLPTERSSSGAPPTEIEASVKREDDANSRSGWRW
jgi:ATP-dependent Clp protease ATP-binding subunit ClpB